MDKLIEELTALENKATAGEWRYLGDDAAGVQMGRDGGFSLAYEMENRVANARLIAALRNAFPALKREREELIGALRDAKDALYNGFEPDNQSRAWHKIDALLSRVK